MKFFWLLVFTLVIALVTHDGIGRRRARAASKYDLNPQLTIAEHRTAYAAREDQRDREAMFGWNEVDEDGSRRSAPEVEVGLPIDVVLVATFRGPAEAYLLQGRLSSTGIKAAVIDPPPRSGDPAYRLYVASDRAAEAVEVIAELRQLNQGD